MLKKILLILVFFIILILVYYFIFALKRQNQSGSDKSTSISSEPEITTIINPLQSVTPVITSSSGDYQLNYLIVRPTDIIELYSNLENKLTSTEAKNNSGCLSLVNGGFYGTDNKPIGLFYTQGKLTNNASDNELFNGFFLIDNNEHASIDLNSPDDLKKYRIALQAGPILYLSGRPSNIASKSDPARRIIVGISNRNEITFISLNSKNNPVSGPKLEELPLIIKNINNKTGLNILDAINLDGGNHSAFLTESVNLTEFAAIGSYFCIKSK
jgi:hypothetical protein